MTRPDLPSAAVVIAAGGSGTRLGGTKKQLRLLGDKPLLVQTTLRFQKHRHVEVIAIAAPKSDVDDVRTMCDDFGLSKVVAVVAGGSIRQDSVRFALASLPASSENVLTHDAVRPFVSSSDIDEVLRALIDHDAAVLVKPVIDTLCRGVDGQVSERVDRAGVFRLLTPQGFRRTVLERGHERAAQESRRYTDEVTLVKDLGIEVVMVPCHSPNIKITTPADWDQARWMWPPWAEENE